MTQTLIVVEAANLGDLAAEINQAHEACGLALRASVEHALKVGKLLAEAKSLCAHGTWSRWLTENCTMSEVTAQRYMRVARKLPPLLEANPSRVTDLSFRDALQLLAKAEDEPMSLKPHVAYNNGENEWYTPLEYIDAAKHVMGAIDLDPASTEIANKTVGAKRYFTKRDDGLSKDWRGRVWMNPPYAGELISLFAEKLAASVETREVTQSIVLVNNATETAWFGRLVEVASAVVFTKSRVKFLDPDGNPGAPLQGQAIIYAGLKVATFLDEFAMFGWGAKL